MEEILKQLRLQNERLNRIEEAVFLPKKVMKIDEASSLTGFSKSYLYRLVQQKGIPYYKKAKYLFFDKAELENWLKSNRHTPISELQNKADSYTIRKQGK